MAFFFKSSDQKDKIYFKNIDYLLNSSNFFVFTIIWQHNVGVRSTGGFFVEMLRFQGHHFYSYIYVKLDQICEKN